MPTRRSDREIEDELKSKLRRVIERQARKDDPWVKELRKLADQIVEMLEKIDLAFPKEEMDVLLGARKILIDASNARIAEFAKMQDR